MKRVSIRNIIVFVLVAAAGISLALFLNQKNVQPPKEQAVFSAWLSDWDYKKGISDFDELESSLTQVQLFAAYFNSNDGIFFTENFSRLKDSLNSNKKADGPKLFLTIVNDRIKDDGSTVQKDPTILTRILQSDQSRSRHIDELLKKTREGGFDGIEIDYEKIPQQSLEGYADFISELYKKAAENKLSLRVVLESGVNLNKLSLPEGPQYAVMLYNLYGTHSGPGPKADYKFIGDTLKKFSKLPGRNNITALSLGGFDWPDNGKAGALTEEQAAKLAKDYGAETSRDKDSGALKYSYTDEKNIKHTVWYADMKTVEGWTEECQNQGFNNIALWRLGGCSKEFIEFLNRGKVS